MGCGASSKPDFEKAPCTDLIQAATSGTSSQVRQLLAAGSDVEYRDADGNTALIAASSNGHADSLKLLIDARSAFDGQNILGCTALTTSAFQGHPDCVKLLINAKASITMKDEHGRTALQLAEQCGKAECVQLLKTEEEFRHKFGDRTVQDLKADGVTLSELKEGGLALQDIKEGLFSAFEAVAAGYSVFDVFSAGYSVSELQASGLLKGAVKVKGAGTPIVNGLYAPVQLTYASNTNFHRRLTTEAESASKATYLFCNGDGRWQFNPGTEDGSGGVVLGTCHYIAQGGTPDRVATDGWIRNVYIPGSRSPAPAVELFQ